MDRRLFLHDLPEEDFLPFGLSVTALDTVFSAEPIIGPCIGCYGCWLKTPGTCTVNDRGKGFPSLIAAHDEFIVISRLVFGGFSPAVKAVLDRSIGYILPFFRLAGNETHHPGRYGNKPALRYIFYGEALTSFDKEIAEKLTKANALNLSAKSSAVEFFDSRNKETV